mgnify:CR=1 FL=1
MDRRITVNPAAVYDELVKINSYREIMLGHLAMLNSHPDKAVAEAAAPFTLTASEFLDSLNALEDLLTEEWDGDEYDEEDYERTDE